MATLTTVTITDDINGQPDAETRTFSLGDDFYEIDLADTSYTSLQKAMKKFIDHGRKVGHPGRAVTRHRTKVTRVATNTSAMRDWARQNGWPELSSRGRVPTEIVEAYDAAHPH